MNCYKEPYGADADGNRGIIITNAEITEDDTEEIIAQLIDMYEYGQEFYTIFLYCDRFDTEHEFTVSIYDYLTKAELAQLEEDNE